MHATSRALTALTFLTAVAAPLAAQGATPAPATPAAPAATPAGPLKLAYVNSRQILEQSPGRTLAEAQFEKEMLPFRTQIQTMSDSVQKLITGYQRAAATLTAAQRQTRESAIGQTQAEFRERSQQMEQQALQRQQELMAPVMEQINKVIQDIRTEQGYSFILDAGAQVPVIVSADKAYDITETVLARLKTLGAPKLPSPQAANAGESAPSSVPVPGAAGRTGPVSSPSGATRPGRP